jgi:hemoglobin
MTQTAPPTLYDRLGGAPAVNAATELFYRKVLADESLAPFFDDVDMDRQIAKQAAFLTMVLGGPAAYSGKDMRQAHGHLVAKGLDDGHVDAVLGHLRDTLADLGVPAQEVAEVVILADSVRGEVLSR